MHSILHHIHHAFSRHHVHAAHQGHRGFSGFGGHRHGFRGGDPSQPGPDGLQRGRKLGAADLQLLLLALLAEQPSHGYELIKALDERSSGYYSPSPGMVYPALTYLEEIGHASVETQGTKKLYSVTSGGREHLDAQRAAVDALLQQLAWIGARMEKLRAAMAGAGPADPAADNADAATAAAESPWGSVSGRGRGRHGFKAPEMRAAWRSLQTALADKAAAAPAEQQRIAAILEHAAAAIRDDSSGSNGPAGAAGATGTQDRG